MGNETLIGAGGGGGGSSDYVQKPDNLRSNDVFEALLGLCSGPIKGPVDGLKSIRVNGTPILDASGQNNFGTSFLATFADGDPLKFPQKATLKLGSAGAPEVINVQIRNDPSVGGNPWVSRTVSATGAEAIDLRFIVNQLYKQSEDGIFENTLNLEVQMKPVGTTTWINPLTNNATSPPPSSGSKFTDLFTYYSVGEDYGTVSGGGYSTLRITGKTTSPYVKELRVQVPNTGVYANKAWDIRVRLLEPETVDDDPNFEKRNISWESATAVFTSTLGTHEDWRGLAWLQIYGEASQNFTGIPDIDGEYFCKIVSVPPSTVYNPDTRTYSGTVWNGSWAKAYTNDPAWVINDVITDSISGLAAFVPGAQLNKWDALELSKWCSEAVDDGNGGTHPRFSMNLFVDQPQKTDEFIRYLAGACSATAWDNGGGEWRVKIDRPQTPVAVFTQENIEGEFIYSHTDIDTRFNDVTVVFLNEEFDYREDRLRIKDDDHIAKFGRKPTKVVGIGITNYQQALRWAVLRLRTNINEKRAVSFTTNRQGKLLERFDWILIADASLNIDGTNANRLSTGRIIQNKGGSVVVRDPVRLETGVAYKLHLSVPNPNYNPEPTSGSFHPDYQLPTIAITRNITNSAAQRGENVTELFIDSALPANAAENANVALEAVGLPAIPKAYRIVDVDYAEDGERINVNAMEIDTAKWAASDRGDYSYEFPRQNPGPGGGSAGASRLGRPTAPVGGMWTLTSYSSAYEGTRYTLLANWDPPVSTSQVQFSKYHLRYKAQDGAWQDLGFTTDDFFELQDPQGGRHTLEVRAVDTTGRESLPLRDSYNVNNTPRSVSISMGPALINASYDASGTTPQDLPKEAIYKLVSNGKEVTATWQYRVTDGGVNGFTPSSGWQNMTADGTAGIFTLNSVQVPDSVVEIKGTYRKMSASISVAVDKLLGTVENTGGTSGGTTLSQTSGFGTIPTPGSSFVPISQDFNLVVGSGQTAKAIIALSCTMPKTASNLGPWNVEYKLQREISGVWTDAGAVQNSNPDAYTEQEYVDPYSTL